MTLERARVAVAVVFALNGLAFASWISRTPAVRDALGLSASQLGLLLLCMSGGAVAALPLSGPLVHRVGPARAVLLGAASVAAGLVVVATGVSTQVVALAGIGLVLTGLGTSTWDVAMNVEGADVERGLRRTLMPRFHAGFSLGTVAGALLGAGCAALGVPVAAQFVATAGVALGTVLVAVRSFVGAPARETTASSGVAGAWRERRTLLVGLCVLAFAFAEGTANDWLTLALVDGYGTSEAVGAVGFGVFVAAMTVARAVGGTVLERYGRVPVLRATAGFALVGLLLVVFGTGLPGGLPWALAGAVLWGAGAALGFPVGMSAAADDPARAAARVSVVSSIGYTAFLAGPPLIGFLADGVGVLRALLVVLVLLVVALATVGATRPLPVEDREPAAR